MIRQRALGAIRRAQTGSTTSTTTTSSSGGGSSNSSSSSLRSFYLLHGGRGGAMHFYYGGGTGRSIFTTAAALASAYYMGGLGACYVPRVTPSIPDTRTTVQCIVDHIDHPLDDRLLSITHQNHPTGRAGSGGVAACEAPVLPPPSPPQVIKFPVRRNHTDAPAGGGGGGGGGNQSAE
jgi:hypothetical protein